MENKNYIKKSNETGSVNIAEDVVAVIVGAAAADVDGVASLGAYGSREPLQISGKKALARSVKVDIGDDGSAAISVAVIAQRGGAVAQIGADVQSAVIRAVSDACGIVPKVVNVKIAGIKIH